jgi:hypothetical protein
VLALVNYFFRRTPAEPAPPSNSSQN